MPNIGPLELAIVLLIVLVIFGPKRLPGLGRQLGSGMREFKDAITGKGKETDDDDAGPVRAALSEGAPQAQPDPHATPAPDAEALRQPAPPPGA
jgi:sec-independent protein translocase protein TatA